MTAALPPGLFSGIRIEAENDDDYERVTMYPHWDRVPDECFDVRNAVLAAESVVPVTWLQTSPTKCKVTAGEWHDPYTGETFTDPADLDIDHVVALKEAHNSGASEWTQERRREYANFMENPDHLIAVKDSENQSKSDKDPAAWVPPNEAYLCDYLRIWLNIKRDWDLSIDEEEEVAIEEKSAACTS